MLDRSRRRFASHPPFDPEKGRTIIEPPGGGAGYWAGACSVLLREDRYYLYYRLRRPRGEEPDRGYECRVAASPDGIRFTDTLRIGKEELQTTSMERSCLVESGDGGSRLYISYVDNADGRWRIDMMEADSPDGFRAGERVGCLTAAACGCEGVKDPWVFRVADKWHMMLSYATSGTEATGAERERMHATHDVYNTGIAKSATALASSDDGVRWEWRGGVFLPPDNGWDRYCRRVNGLVWSPPVWIAFYDGAACVEQNYEERTGIAVSGDLRRFVTASPSGPAIGAASGPGGVRYVEPVETESEWRFYYEYTRPDGSHELRLSVVPK